MRRSEHPPIRRGAEHAERIDVPMVVVRMAPVVLVNADVDEVVARYEVEPFEVQPEATGSGDLVDEHSVVGRIRVVADEAVRDAADRDDDDGGAHRPAGRSLHDEGHLERRTG